MLKRCLECGEIVKPRGTFKHVEMNHPELVEKYEELKERLFEDIEEPEQKTETKETKESREETEQEEKYMSPEEEMIEEIAKLLSRELPKVPGISREKAEMIVEDFRLDPNLHHTGNLYAHIKMACPRANDYFVMRILRQAEKIAAEYNLDYARTMSMVYGTSLMQNTGFGWQPNPQGFGQPLHPQPAFPGQPAFVPGQQFGSNHPNMMMPVQGGTPLVLNPQLYMPPQPPQQQNQPRKEEDKPLTRKEFQKMLEEWEKQQEEKERQEEIKQRLQRIDKLEEYLSSLAKTVEGLFNKVEKLSEGNVPSSLAKELSDLKSELRELKSRAENPNPASQLREMIGILKEYQSTLEPHLKKIENLEMKVNNPELALKEKELEIQKEIKLRESEDFLKAAKEVANTIKEGFRVLGEGVGKGIATGQTPEQPYTNMVVVGDRIRWLCPSCGREGESPIDVDEIRCTSCNTLIATRRPQSQQPQQPSRASHPQTQPQPEPKPEPVQQETGQKKRRKKKEHEQKVEQ